MSFIGYHWREPRVVLPGQPVLLLGLCRSGKVGKKENKAVDRDLHTHH